MKPKTALIIIFLTFLISGIIIISSLNFNKSDSLILEEKVKNQEKEIETINPTCFGNPHSNLTNEYYCLGEIQINPSIWELIKSMIMIGAGIMGFMIIINSIFLKNERR